MRKITKKMTVFLVDDDADDRLIFSKAIERVAEACTVVQFRDGLEAIEAVKKEENLASLPDIIFLDVNMPVIDGIETLAIIRNELKLYDQPIAMYSTSRVEADMTNALVAGANVYIKKPSKMADLTEVLCKVLNAVIQYHDTFEMKTFVLSV